MDLKDIDYNDFIIEKKYKIKKMEEIQLELNMTKMK